MINKLKIAIVADWLTSNGGAEKVTEAIMSIYPDAPIYTSVFNKKNFTHLSSKKIYTSFLQKIPFSKTKHQLFSILRPYAFESFNFSNYDIVISSAHAEAKGIITKPYTMHVSYCHTPTRYYWSDYHEYYNRLEFGILNPIIKILMPSFISKMRFWDKLASERVDYFIANSKYVAKRIMKYYRKEAEVIYPPVQCSNFEISKSGYENFYLAGGRLIPYKKIDIVVKAFNDLKNEKLIIFGTGPEEKKLKKIASKNIEFVGKINNDELKKLFSKCKAYIFPQDEDFGIVAVEAQASGRPVIAYRKGGALETIKEGITGVFFNEQTPPSLIDAIKRFNPDKYNPQLIRQHSLQFDISIFNKKIHNFITEKWEDWKKTMK